MRNSVQTLKTINKGNWVGQSGTIVWLQNWDLIRCIFWCWSGAVTSEDGEVKTCRS